MIVELSLELGRELSLEPGRVLSLEPGRVLSLELEGVADDDIFKNSSSPMNNSAWVVVKLSLELGAIDGPICTVGLVTTTLNPGFAD